MTYETQSAPHSHFPEDTGAHRALPPSAEEIALRSAARVACEADFRDKWNLASRQRHAEGKPASFRGPDGRHLTLLPVELQPPAEEAVITDAESPATIELGSMTVHAAQI